MQHRTHNSIKELETSASMAGKPVPGFKKLEFKIASGLKRILTGSFKKQVSTTGVEIAHGQTDRLKDLRLSGCNEEILDFRDPSKLQLDNDNLQAFNTKCERKISSADTDGPPDKNSGTWLQDADRKVKRIDTFIASQYSRDNIRREGIQLFKIEIDGSQTLGAEDKGFSFQSKKRDEDKSATRASQKKVERKNQKQRQK